MIDRHLSEALLREARRMPIVTLTGPRQSGKTTLVRHLFPDHAYVSLERPDRRAAAREDPLGFLSLLSGSSVILDEVQRAPELLSYLQVEVDEDDRPGRFVLTGSQDLLLLRTVSQTLAGRTAILRLLPLSIAELLGRPPFDPCAATKRPPAIPARPTLNLWETLHAGFFPRIHDKGLDPTRWLADYHRTYVERDVRDFLRIGDVDSFERFVRLAAARTGTVLNLTSLAADVGISQPTAKSWLSALRIGGLVTLLPPHHANFRKRLRKRPKLHFLDTGLVCYLLGIGSPAVLASHPLRGAIFESYVVGELAKAFEHTGREAPLYHWRDTSGRELDVLVDLGQRLLPVEVKSGMTLASDAFAGVRWWTALPDNPNGEGLVIYGGADLQVRGDLTALPWYLA